MKWIMAFSMFFFSFLAFAQNPPVSSAVDALTSVIKVGIHLGQNERGECSVKVMEVNFPDKAVSVVIEEKNGIVSKLVEDGTSFSFKKFKNEFIQTNIHYINYDPTAYVEQIIKTVNTDSNKLYVVTSYAAIMNTERTEEIAECIIDL